jgi:hypothetical protein
VTSRPSELSSTSQADPQIRERPEVSSGTKHETSGNSRHPALSTADIDRINLSQALRDFEVANARVIDLTARLTETHRRLADTQHELSLTRVHVGNLEAIIAGHEGTAQVALNARMELATVQQSRSFRLAVLMSRIARKVLS